LGHLHPVAGLSVQRVPGAGLLRSYEAALFLEIGILYSLIMRDVSVLHPCLHRAARRWGSSGPWREPGAADRSSGALQACAHTYTQPRRENVLKRHANSWPRGNAGRSTTPFPRGGGARGGVSPPAPPAAGAGSRALAVLWIVIVRTARKRKGSVRRDGQSFSGFIYNKALSGGGCE
jgi:hypothetical protein